MVHTTLWYLPLQADDVAASTASNEYPAEHFWHVWTPETIVQASQLAWHSTRINTTII